MWPYQECDGQKYFILLKKRCNKEAFTCSSSSKESQKLLAHMNDTEDFFPGLKPSRVMRGSLTTETYFPFHTILKLFCLVLPSAIIIIFVRYLCYCAIKEVLGLVKNTSNCLMEQKLFCHLKNAMNMPRSVFQLQSELQLRIKSI